ncbi:MAG TPA: GFA family protein [Burkholderiaceae bacterium]|nr:GFA family protein [Burkholderiaceae bacterium]
MPQNPELLLRCSCGTVELAISGSPAACAYCHCSTCRDFYSLPVLAATAWKNDAVRVTKGNDRLGEYKHLTKQMQRHFCLACGETLFGANRLGLTVVRTSLLVKALGGSLPAEFTPKFHLFYAYREFDVDDELPKYLEGRSGPLFSKDVPPQA